MNTLLEPPLRKAANVADHWQPKVSHRILLVDDDKAVRRLSAEALARAGFQVDTAEDGEAGWEAVQVHDYDLLITDDRMPGLSGLELIEKLRAAQMRLPVVLASATLTVEELNRNEWLDIAATLWKPFTLHELSKTTEEVLRLAGSARGGSGGLFPGFGEALTHIEPIPRWDINE